MNSQKDVSFSKILGTKEVMAVSFGLVVCVSTWGATLLGFAIYGVGFIFSVVLAGLFYFLIAMNYSELATMYPRAASIRTYVQTEYGNRPGSVASMIYILSFAAGLSAEVIFFSYVLNGFVPSIPWQVWALCVTTFALIVNMIGIKRVGQLSDYLLYVVVAITLIVSLLSFTGATVQTPDFGRLSTGFFTDGFAGLIGSFLLAMWLFAGFEVACPLAEECKNPKRDLPRGMFFAILVIGILNILFGLGAYVLVSPDILTSEKSLAVIGSSIAGTAGVIALFLFAVCCTTATVMTNYSSVSRLMYGMAEKPQNILPANWKWLHPKFKTPWKTLCIYYAFTLILIFSFGSSMSVLIYIASFIWIIQYLIAIVTNIALRSKIPNFPRPYRVPGGSFKVPLLSILGLAGILFFLIFSVTPPFGDINVLYYGTGMIIAIILFSLVWGHFASKKKNVDTDLSI
jgi:amino acid transporter